MRLRCTCFFLINAVFIDSPQCLCVDGALHVPEHSPFIVDGALHVLNILPKKVVHRKWMCLCIKLAIATFLMGTTLKV